MDDNFYVLIIKQFYYPKFKLNGKPLFCLATLPQPLLPTGPLSPSALYHGGLTPADYISQNPLISGWAWPMQSPGGWQEERAQGLFVLPFLSKATSCRSTRVSSASLAFAGNLSVVPVSTHRVSPVPGGCLGHLFPQFLWDGGSIQAVSDPLTASPFPLGFSILGSSA